MAGSITAHIMLEKIALKELITNFIKVSTK
jgi:hypothetical protein